MYNDWAYVLSMETFTPYDSVKQQFDTSHFHVIEPLAKWMTFSLNFNDRPFESPDRINKGYGGPNPPVPPDFYRPLSKNKMFPIEDQGYAYVNPLLSFIDFSLIGEYILIE